MVLNVNVNWCKIDNIIFTVKCNFMLQKYSSLKPYYDLILATLAFTGILKGGGYLKITILYRYENMKIIYLFLKYFTQIIIYSFYPLIIFITSIMRVSFNK